MGKYIEGDYDIIGEYNKPSDSNHDDILISIYELFDKLADKNQYEKMRVYSIKELILSCNKIFTQK